MRELAPTAAIWRGDGVPSDLGVVPLGLGASIDALAFADLQGRKLTWAQSLRNTYTDGIVVLHRGRRIYERYFGAVAGTAAACVFLDHQVICSHACRNADSRACWTKPKRCRYYLPEMIGTAYEDATLAPSARYANRRAVFRIVCGSQGAYLGLWARRGPAPARPELHGPRNFYDYLRTLRKEGAHGAAFAYKTVNTEVMCWVMKRITGVSLSDMLSQRIWSQIGCEEDGYVTVDTIGVAMGGGGMSASLRDLCRFGELMRCDGAWHGKQVIPAEVIADIRRGADPAKFAMAGYTLLPGYSYRNMWWVSHNALGMFEGRGIHGQRLYIAPKAELVIARFCSHPIATSAANDPVTLPAFAAMSQLLMSG